MTLFASRKTGQLKATTSKTEKLLASILTIMKPIRIVKRSADRDANTTETQKPDEPSTSKIVNTVKKLDRRVAGTQAQPATFSRCWLVSIVDDSMD